MVIISEALHVFLVPHVLAAGWRSAVGSGVTLENAFLLLTELPVSSINRDLLKLFLYPSGLIRSKFFVLQTFLWGTELFPWLFLTLRTPSKRLIVAIDIDKASMISI